MAELDEKIGLLDEAIDALDEDGDSDEYDRLDKERSALDATLQAPGTFCAIRIARQGYLWPRI